MPLLGTEMAAQDFAVPQTDQKGSLSEVVAERGTYAGGQVQVPHGLRQVAPFPFPCSLRPETKSQALTVA